MLRLIGQYVFNPESPAAIAMLLIVSFPLMALVARRICTDAKVAREQWPAAAIFFLMPSLILDTSVAAGCGARRCSPTVRSPRSTEKIRAWTTARMHSVFVQMLALPNARRDVDVALFASLMDRLFWDLLGSRLVSRPGTIETLAHAIEHSLLKVSA